MKINLNWVNYNTNEDGTRVFRSTAPFSDTSLMTPLAVLPQGANSFVDEDTIHGQMYYYSLEVFKGTDYYPGPVIGVMALAYTGPGRQDLAKGDYSRGYFGEVTYLDLMSGDELALVLGIAKQGASINPLTTWFKFAHKGKILFIPRLPLRQTLTWKSLYDAGLVFGTEDNGSIFEGLTPVLQNKKVTINGDVFRVRLMKGFDTPTYIAGTSKTVGSEYNDLFYSIINTVPAEQTWGNLENFEDTTVFQVNTNQLCQEMSASSSIWPRVYNSPSSPGSVTPNFGITATTNNIWRPVLELIS